MGYFDTKIENILERNGIDPKAPPNPKNTAQVIQLEIWEEPKRGTPNQVLRGALFSAIKGSNRKAFQRELLASQNGFEIRFTGIQLGQNDLDTFELALHLSRLQPLGKHIYFTENSFLKALGRCTGKSQHEQLKDEFARLSCGLEITDIAKKLTYGGSLIEYLRDDATGRMVLQINPRMRKLFDKGWTAIDFDERKKLKSKPLAQWLHAFISTHAKIHPIKIDTYKALSGSNTKDKYKFKQSLSKALQALQDIGVINHFNFENGLVYINHTPSKLQKKHLAKKPKSLK